MKKCELLSPAGNMEMLKYAVMYGADAVYLAGVKFGARKYALNFTLSELDEAIKFAHLYGVRVYITVNTLIHEDEIEEFIDYVKTIYRLGVDAVLVQDYGMLKLIRSVCPNLEIHASTQMHNNHREIVELLIQDGVKRVVLDREMSLEEIKSMPAGVELEVFVHGALCVCYSGQCLFSSYVLNRSGNRGECAGLCRLPYRKRRIDGTVDSKPAYYLSLKDLCTANNVDKLISAGVDSLKIEGRMKSPEYVGYITKIYRRLIDSAYEGNFNGVSSSEMKNIALLFNRGFTTGYMFKDTNDNMVNRESPNHQGIYLGKYTSKKRIEIHLEEPLEQGDTIRFKEDNKGMTVNFLYDHNGKLINSGNVGETVFVDNFLEIKGSGEVRKVSSKKLNDEIHDIPKRTVLIDVSIDIKRGNPIKMTVNDGVNEVVKYGVVVEEALNSPISEASVTKQIDKTGDTIYKIDRLKLDLDDNVFVNIKDLNAIRREVLNELDQKRQEISYTPIVGNYEYRSVEPRTETDLTVVINTMEQYEVVKNFTNSIYTSNVKLLEADLENLHPKYIDSADEFSKGEYMISDLGSVKKITRGDRVKGDYMLNVINSYTIRELISSGLDTVMLSCEANIEDVKNISKNVDVSRVEYLVYGKIELMKMKFDPLREKETLIDRNGCEYKIKKDAKYGYLMSHDAIDRTKLIDELLKLGVKNFRLDFFDEDAVSTKKIVEKVHKKIYKE